MRKEAASGCYYNEKCLHCGGNAASYCESCYQELVAENMKLQAEKEAQYKRFQRYKEKWEQTHEEIYEMQQVEIEKKDKVIDLMAEELYEEDNIFGFGIFKEINTPEKIKEYFEKKVEGE